MFIKRGFSLQRRHVAVSLAGASIISFFCKNLFMVPIGVEALSVVGRFITVQGNKETKTITKPLKNYTCRRAHLSSFDDFAFIPNIFRRMVSNRAFYSTLQLSETTSVESVPKWASETFKLTHASFEKAKEVYIQELGLAAVIYKHKSTGLSVFSLVTDTASGREMFFDIVIPTPPFNDCGCPHILEHAVLEGSKKYPSKDGFALLLQGGFQSFVNAFTYKDRTSYLFASTNEKDFYITADFYMSAVFQPNIRHDSRIFRQEAWHYKVAKHNALNVEEDDGVVLHGRHISYGGVVYSEMKKAYSDPLSRAQDYIYQAMYTNSYRFDSGGDPNSIVKLKYPELVKFYETYYGPNTANIYFYGPDDVSKRLNFVDNFLKENGIVTDGVLYSSQPETAKKQLTLEVYRELDGVIRGSFGATGDEREDIILTGWLLDPQDKNSNNIHVEGKFKIDSVDALGMEVLEHILMGTSESLLYKALVKSGLGKKVVGSGLTNCFKQSDFVIGLAGIDCEKHGSKENARLIYDDVLMSTFKNIVKNGIKKEAINASMNHIEFQMRELNPGSYPKGLMLVNLVQSQTQYDRDPFAPLYFDSLIKQLKGRIAGDPSYFQRLVAKHFMDNKHKVTVHMEAMNPDEFEKLSNRSIRDALMQSLGTMSKTSIDDMESEYEQFKTECEATEDSKVLDALPTLSLADINSENDIIPTVYYVLGEPKSYAEAPKIGFGGIPVLCHPIESQGIVYLDLAISLEDLDLDEIKYMDIWCNMFQESGTYGRSAEDMSYHISTHLGGLTATFSFMTAANGRKHSKRNDALGYIYVRSKALKGKENDMVDIVMEMLTSCNFANGEKGLEIIKRKINQMELDVTNSGHRYATRRLMKGFSVADYATEVSKGYEYLTMLKTEIYPKAENDWSHIASKLEKIRCKLLKSKNLIINVTSSPDITKQWLEQGSETLSNKFKGVFVVPKEGQSGSNWVAEVINKGNLHAQNEVIVAPTKVNFVGMGGPLFNEEEISGADDLVLHYISSSYLWKQVRMSLGAYGVFCNMSACGDIVFMSYADPNFNETLQVYKNVPNAIADALKSMDEKQLLRQKIGKIGGIDKPLTVDAKGFVALNRIIRRETDEDRQLYREDILKATVKCFDRLRAKMKDTEEWHKVCAVVNQTTADALPAAFSKLDVIQSNQ